MIEISLLSEKEISQRNLTQFQAKMIEEKVQIQSQLSTIQTKLENERKIFEAEKTIMKNEMEHENQKHLRQIEELKLKFSVILNHNQCSRLRQLFQLRC